MTVSTRTWRTRSHNVLIEYSSNFSDAHNAGFSFQGASAYLVWNFAFSGYYLAWLDANFVNFSVVASYVAWGL